MDMLVKNEDLMTKQDHEEQIKLCAREMDRRCGCCAFWMLLDQCPREYPTKGGHHGPSGDSFACGRFKLSVWYAGNMENEEQ
jgi:hypothetical protein